MLLKLPGEDPVAERLATGFFAFGERGIEMSPLALGMSHASLSGLVVCEDTRGIRPQCSALVHAKNVGWMEILFGFAAAIQRPT